MPTFVYLHRRYILTHFGDFHLKMDNQQMPVVDREEWRRSSQRGSCVLVFRAYRASVLAEVPWVEDSQKAALAHHVFNVILHFQFSTVYQHPQFQIDSNVVMMSICFLTAF